MNIPHPSISEVETYLAKWETLENYAEQEKALATLFSRTYPHNECLDEVLVKVCALNTFYSTNIRGIYSVAKHIVSLHIDERLAKNDLQLVSDIAKITIKEKSRTNFSFATKYCSFHKPDVYPIADSFGQKFLKYFMTEGTGWREYPQYVEIVKKFMETYGLGNFTFKQIDRYIWQAGREYFGKKK
jgi:hypothetical protein